MKQLKGSLDKAIHELGTRDENTISGLLSIVERMAVDLKPAARQAVTPIGNSCRTMTIKSDARSDTFDEADAAAITKDASDELTDVRPYTILITELDLERGSCKTHIDPAPSDKRVNAIITDPLLQMPNNPYSLAFAAAEKIDVKAKALLKDGEISRLYISDVGV